MKTLFYSFAVIFFVQIIHTEMYAQEGNYVFLCDSVRIRTDLKAITQTPKSRNYQNIPTLDSVASYIKNELGKVCDSVRYQTFVHDKRTYRNVIGSIGTQNKKRLVVGAHYDVCGNQEGADDNASGTAGLLELARLLSMETDIKYRYDFVAYTLEEPPYFGGEWMGSNIHAKSLFDNHIKIEGMVCLEMIGYFDLSPNSQAYPNPAMRKVYGDKGDFISVIQKKDNGKFPKRFAKEMIKQKIIETNTLKATVDVQGVDFSDHRNYWNYNYPAAMVTNTSFYRNPNYHKISDTLETLDIYRMSLVIDEIYQVLRKW